MRCDRCEAMEDHRDALRAKLIRTREDYADEVDSLRAQFAAANERVKALEAGYAQALADDLTDRKKAGNCPSCGWAGGHSNACGTITDAERRGYDKGYSEGLERGREVEDADATDAEVRAHGMGQKDGYRDGYAQANLEMARTPLTDEQKVRMDALEAQWREGYREGIAACSAKIQDYLIRLLKEDIGKPGESTARQILTMVVDTGWSAVRDLATTEVERAHRKGYDACTADVVAWLAANVTSVGGAGGQTMANTVAMEWARENRRTLLAIARCIRVGEHVGCAGKGKP